MKMLRLLVALGVALGLGWWIWTVKFPNPRRQIQNRLNDVAHLVSFSPDEGSLGRIADIQRLGRFFSEDVQVMVEIPPYEAHTFQGRAEIMQVVMASKRLGNGLKVEFLDMNIEMGTGDQDALVDLTLKGKFNGESDLIAQELKVTLKKIEGVWLITRVETIRPLKP